MYISNLIFDTDKTDNNVLKADYDRAIKSINSSLTVQEISDALKENFIAIEFLEEGIITVISQTAGIKRTSAYTTSTLEKGDIIYKAYREHELLLNMMHLKEEAQMIEAHKLHMEKYAKIYQGAEKVYKIITTPISVIYDLATFAIHHICKVTNYLTRKLCHRFFK